MIVHRYPTTAARRCVYFAIVSLLLVELCCQKSEAFRGAAITTFQRHRRDAEWFLPSSAVKLLLSLVVLTTTRGAALSVNMSVTNTNDHESQTRCIKLVLLDRDGVINQDVGAPGVIDPQQLALTPGAGHAMGNLKRAGLQVAMITNQSCVGKGLINAGELAVIQTRLQAMLLAEDDEATWDTIYEATTTTDMVDPRRKPAPGMILEACQDFGVDPEETVFVGDTLTDLQAAHAAGVSRRILVSTGYGTGIMEEAGLLMSGDRNKMESMVLDSQKEPKQMKRHQQSNSTRTTTVDNTKTNSPLERVMPFIYVPNLRSASEWILAQHQH